MITATVIGVLIVALGFGGNAALAGSPSCGNKFVPNVTYYAPYPWWWPQYFGPPHSDYQVVQYFTPPAETAAMVKARLRVINAANPALLPLPSEMLPAPKTPALKQETLPPPK